MQSAFTIHSAGAAALLSRLLGFCGLISLKPFNEFAGGNIAGFAEIKRFETINAPFADLGFRDECLRLAEFFRKRRLAQSGLLADFSQQGAEPAIAW